MYVCMYYACDVGDILSSTFLLYTASVHPANQHLFHVYAK